MSPWAGWGPRSREGQWFLQGMGQKGEASHQGCWVYLLSCVGHKDARGGHNPGCPLPVEYLCLSPGWGANGPAMS